MSPPALHDAPHFKFLEPDIQAQPQLSTRSKTPTPVTMLPQKLNEVTHSRPPVRGFPTAASARAQLPSSAPSMRLSKLLLIHMFATSQISLFPTANTCLCFHVQCPCLASARPRPPRSLQCSALRSIRSRQQTTSHGRRLSRGSKCVAGRNISYPTARYNMLTPHCVSSPILTCDKKKLDAVSNALERKGPREPALAPPSEGWKLWRRSRQAAVRLCATKGLNHEARILALHASLSAAKAIERVSEKKKIVSISSGHAVWLLIVSRV